MNERMDDKKLKKCGKKNNCKKEEKNGNHVNVPHQWVLCFV